MKLKGKIAIITGASRGIGEAIAKEYAKEGATLTLVSRSRRIFDVSDALETPVLAMVGDIRDPAFVERFFAKTADRFGGLDILVNNAGVQGPIGPLAENDPGEWLKTVEINLFGTFLCCRQAIPIMKKRGGGRIINLSGGGSTSPRPHFTAYGASKTAVVRLTETLAQEVGSFNIQVNAIAPGAINTRMLEEVISAGDKAGSKASQEALQQLKNGGTSISKPVTLALFLASDDSGEISGKLISAVWDDRAFISRSVSKLNETDMFTLRRIS